MEQALLSWSSPCHHFLPPNFPFSSKTHFLKLPKTPKPPQSAALQSSISDNKAAELTAKERRKLRNERRESNMANNWREEVEERLLKKPKKQYKSWTEQLNLDNLALLGPQWWVVRVSRVSSHEIAERIAKALIRNFPDVDFKVYAPAVQVKRKLKNGTYSIKPKPIFPGCVFLRCVLNKELHDSIRECDGVGGFVGSKVGNTKRQINRPKPVSTKDIEAIFREAKEEQVKANKAFEEEQEREQALNSEQSSNVASTDVKAATNSKRKSKKASEPHTGDLTTQKDDKLLIVGSTVRVLSGSFAEFSGTVKNLDCKTRTATIGFTLFGKETLADINFNEILVEAE